MRQVFFYVDGFNLYHRALEKQPHLKWLCLKTLVTKHLFPRAEIGIIKYFTAAVDPENPAITPRRARQLAYWNALKSNGVTIIEGRLVPRWYDCNADCRKSYRKMTEKMSDVNLALHVYRDFVEHRPDAITVLSADLDLLPALRMIRDAGKPQPLLQVLLPTDDDDTYFSRFEDYKNTARLIRMKSDWLGSSQLPDNDDSTAIIPTRPEQWK